MSNELRNYLIEFDNFILHVCDCGIKIEISEQITSGNSCYHNIIKFLRTKILTRESKIIIYHNYLQGRQELLRA